MPFSACVVGTQFMNATKSISLRHFADMSPYVFSHCVPTLNKYKERLTSIENAMGRTSLGRQVDLQTLKPPTLASPL
jgi:hypothetical protein